MILSYLQVSQWQLLTCCVTGTVNCVLLLGGIMLSPNVLLLVVVRDRAVVCHQLFVMFLSTFYHRITQIVQYVMYVVCSYDVCCMLMTLYC